VDVACFPDREVMPGVKLVEQAVIEMEGGPNVLRSAVNSMAVCTARCLGYEEKDLKREDASLAATLHAARVVPHQANGRILDGMVDKLGTPPERLLRTVYRYGNISAASNLVTLDFGLRRGNMARRLDAEGRVLEILEQPEHKIRKGDLVLLPSIGGGYLMGCIGFVA
jgi:3-oxoacyl-[acyl-carrier-protein] synthase III